MLLNVYKHTRSAKLYQYALKMIATIENPEYKNLLTSKTKLPSLTDRPYGLYEGELGLLWVLYEFIGIDIKEKEAETNKT